MKAKLKGTSTSAHKLLILLQFVWQIQILGLLVKPVLRIPSVATKGTWSSKEHIPPPFHQIKASCLHVVKEYKEGADRLVIDRFSEGFVSLNGSSAIPRESPEVIITIHGKQYNLTAWANYHPGGSATLRKFINKDATVAF
jgi:hypothetical protein